MSISHVAILAVLTIANIWFNWRVSLRDKRYHGIFRMVGFECLILLVRFNIRGWFREAFSLFQIISWVLLILCLLVAIPGFHTYYTRGKPSDRMEQTTELITAGMYRYIRHPLYLSLILGGFGVMMKDAGWPQISLALLNFLAIAVAARVEEKEMILRFGEEYRRYMKKTWMFFPYLL